MNAPTFLSLFSGIGGLDLGLERAGWSCVGQVEIDPFCRRVLAKHWPDVPRWGDIREVNPDDLPRADLVCGGFPCQPVSTAGKWLGQDDPRWLWPEMARILRGLRPHWALLENVPGLLVRGMGDVLGDLASCGYDAEWDCIPASAVGAPHQRDRVWIVAYPQRQQLRLEPGRRNGQGWPGQAVAGDDGAARPVADADDQGFHRGAELPRGRDALRRAGQVRADADGRGPRALADPDGPAGRPAAWPAVAGTGAVALPAGPPEPGRRGGDVADPQGQRCWPFRSGGASQAWADDLARHAGERRRTDHWAVEPDVGRVAHGVPARVDRLRGLGNAVVPQVAELIGRRILEAAS